MKRKEASRGSDGSGGERALNCGTGKDEHDGGSGGAGGKGDSNGVEERGGGERASNGTGKSRNGDGSGGSGGKRASNAGTVAVLMIWMQGNLTLRLDAISVCTCSIAPFKVV
ncbi:hypothetical protein Bca52824_032594 [Brassica carinata]|uniref:Uncharacterized protein n=1 Tax=Brassica carinata TaxID=52824 RepID=A0A8X7SCY0_BRACI|nr:hypothetical protein Bca52824_032594 [Brassica carinata]